MAQELEKGLGIAASGHYRRILIYGVTGSGKTTLAKWLSEQTEIPWVEVDSLMWEPNWQMVPLDIQRQRIQALCAQDSWIMDAAYGKWLDIPLDRVQLVIGLDYSRSKSFWQLLRRSIARGIDKKTVCNGNVESFKNMFSKDSILLWHVKSFSHKRNRMRKWNQAQTPFRTILLSDPSQVEKLKARIAVQPVEQFSDSND